MCIYAYRHVQIYICSIISCIYIYIHVILSTLYIYVYIYLWAFSFLLSREFTNTLTPSAQPLWAPLGPCGPPWALVALPGPLWASLRPYAPPLGEAPAASSASPAPAARDYTD